MMRINIKKILAFLLCAVPSTLLAAARTAPVPTVVESDFFSDVGAWDVISLVLAAIAFVISCVALNAKRKRRSSSSGSNARFQNDSLKDEQNFGELFKNHQKLERKVSELETQLKSQQLTNEEEQKADNTTSNTSVSTPSGTILKYAKTADGNAFDADALSDLQDNKKIYELTIEGVDKGSFRVTTNKEAQLFALEDPNNYLRCACNYRSFPSHNSTIITDTPGRIERYGNKWTITKLAEIDFS